MNGISKVSSPLAEPEAAANLATQIVRFRRSYDSRARDSVAAQIGGSERAMSGVFLVSMRFGPGPAEGARPHELRRRGRAVPSARSRSGLAAIGEDIKSRAWVSLT